MLSPTEIARYHRHLLLPDFSLEIQEKLKAAKVLVIGAGGLSSPVLLYLAAAGVGKIGIIDGDVVDLSNLQRQVIYKTEDVGKLKVVAAKENLIQYNPHIEVAIYPYFCNKENALFLFKEYDLIVDGSDNFATRYLVNDACYFTERPLVYAAIFQYDGQLTVFNVKNEKGVFSPNYRDIFPTPPPKESVPNCADAGVLGILPGILGTMQASEVIKLITGIGENLIGKLFTLNTLTMQSHLFEYEKDAQNPLSGESPSIFELMDYEAFCNIEMPKSIPEIDATTFFTWKKEGIDFQLIDVRQPFEYESQNVGGLLLPLSTLKENIALISRKKKVVIHCQSGKRSRKAVETLVEEYGFEEVYNLKGGIAGLVSVNSYQ
ncbi:MAG: molybdopterin-synthase adenylyltransferase MoeB [Bacteroidia bacterium]